MSHPDPNGPPDLRPIQIGEVRENPVTGERGTILELPWKNPDHRFIAELIASSGPAFWASTATRRWSNASRSLTVS